MTVELSPRATEIADHARLLLAAGGYNGFSYADLSERVHIGKPSIHHHFPSKVDLVLAVVKRHHEQTQEGLAAMRRQSDEPLAQLQAYTDHWAYCILDGTLPICICGMLAAEMPLLPPQIAHEVQGYFEDLAAWIAEVLEQGVARGQFRLHDTALVEARAFMSTVYGAMLTARALNNPESFGPIARAALHRLTA